MNIEKAITHEIAKMLTVGFEYHDEYGTHTKEAALTPHIKQWISSNKEEIVNEIIKEVGKEKIISGVTESILKELKNNGYWDSYRWKDLVKETAPLIAKEVAQKMYEEHKKDICGNAL